jgi:rhodanese-related sulfurtransferase
VHQLSARELADWLAGEDRQPPLLLDVREPWEMQICRLQGATAMPMRSVPERVAELAPEQPVVVICHHGVRSLQVALYLARLGFSQVYNLQGGMAAWADQVDPQTARY